MVGSQRRKRARAMGGVSGQLLADDRMDVCVSKSLAHCNSFLASFSSVWLLLWVVIE